MMPEDGGSRLVHGDCIEFMNSQPEGCYDIVITDPPYLATSLAFDQVELDWDAISRAILRVLKPNGWFFTFGNVNVFKNFLPLWRHKFEYIWVKNMAVLATANTVRPYYQHENINAFIKPELQRMGDLYFDLDALATEGPRRRSRERMRTSTVTEYQKAHRFSDKVKATDSILRHATTVLHAPNKTSLEPAERTEHPTQKPVYLYETILKGYCPPGGLAFDPFGGSGTLGIAAMNTGRRYHMTELSPEYHAAIQERLRRHVPRMETARRQTSLEAHLTPAGGEI